MLLHLGRHSHMGMAVFRRVVGIGISKFPFPKMSMNQTKNSQITKALNLDMKIHIKNIWSRLH
jgi:hypothetical protein